MIQISRFYFALIFIALLSSMAVAQAAAPAADSRTIPLFVLDHGDPVTGVKAADVSIQDEGKPAEVKLYRGAEAPLRLGVLIDTNSGEQNRPVFIPAIQALEGFLALVAKTGQDRVFIGTFSAKPELSPFMDRRQLGKHAINLTFGSGASLHDTIVQACQERMAKDVANPARRVLVVISDGTDNKSRAKLEGAIAAAQRAGVAVFTVSTFGDRVHAWGDAALDNLAESTGGQSFSPLARDISGVFPSISQQIDGMYVAAFTPAAARDGKFHGLKVKLAGKGTARAPKGYVSEKP